MTDEEFEKRAREAAEKRKGLKIDPLPLDELMAFEFEAGAKWARGQTVDEAERDSLKAENKRWAEEMTELDDRYIQLHIEKFEIRDKHEELEAEIERLKAQWAEERKWIIQAKDDAIDEANVVTLLAESYRAILLKFIKFYNEDYDPTIGNMPLDIYEQAHLALKDGGET